MEKVMMAADRVEEMAMAAAAAAAAAMVTGCSMSR